MKTHRTHQTRRIRKALAVALVAGMTATGGAAWAWGPGGWGDCDGWGAWGGPRMGNTLTPEQIQERRAARHQARFERLASVLSLQEAQKPAWEAFAAAMQERADARNRFFAEQRAAELPKTAAARMERAAAHNAFKTEQLNRTREAVQAFYGQLSDAQKTIFDAEFMLNTGPGMGMRGMGGGMRGMGPGMGGMRGMGGGMGPGMGGMGPGAAQQ